MAQESEYRAHQEWLGYVQPVGLVVSIPALLSAQAYINRNIAAEHQKFLAQLATGKRGEILPQIPDLAAFTQQVLSWELGDLAEAPDDLAVVLDAYGEVLRPTFAVKEPQPKDPERPWLALVKQYPLGTDLDANEAAEPQHWQASPQARLEHLLLKTGVPIGLLFNHTQLRLVYKPAGENSGYATFNVADMVEVSGRPIFAALHELLRAERVFGFGIDPKNRLANILAESRKYQNVVSTQLAEQVLAALYELVRGFQAANAQAKGQILADVLRDDPDHVYAGLLTILLRLVFLLFAEDRDLLSTDPLYSKFYSVTGLFLRLREDAGRHHETMEQRYGAWAQLLVLFRMIFDGARHGKFHLPAREGYLFDPDRYPFLEGRGGEGARGRVGDGQSSPPLSPSPTLPLLPRVPRVSDGVVYRVLQNLLILDGERLSYRTLDVEHIGGVYETMMGFNLEVAQGRSIAIKPAKSHGAPATINLDELLGVKAAERGKWLKEQSDQSLTGQAEGALKSATTLEDLLAALEKKIAREATPHVVPSGAMILQPSDERRKSGSHYTPRSLTEPIVRTTLRPVLEQLGSQPKPEQILDLNVCDPAMGSGAFLVEACRQLAEKLVEAWHVHKCVPAIPPDEDELKHAMRIVAQRCLYGVDKNPLAVDLAKLSLWLATLAKDHPFTFLDHNLKAGDSLVGLTQRQIEEFTWEARGAGVSPAKSSGRGKKAAIQASVFFGDPIKDKLRHVLAMRQQILAAAEHEPYALLRQKLASVDENLEMARLTGDVAIAAFFGADKDKARRELLESYGRKLTLFFGPPSQLTVLSELSTIAISLRTGDHPIEPFHWEIEFPEVFGRENPGFDAIIGNPPFAGKNTLISSNRDGFLDWIQRLHEQSHGNADLVAHFFRRAFDSLRSQGCLGLIATKTIGQGDTRSTGLRWICTHGGTIYAARKRIKWPGQAAVVVSVVNICRGEMPGPFGLDGRDVPMITAYLFHAGGHDDPARLQANGTSSFQGPVVLGMGFTFAETDGSGVANSLESMYAVISKDHKNEERIFPYIGGEDLLERPVPSHSRYVINFGECSEDEARQYPDLYAIVEARVKPERLQQRDNADGNRRREHWWQWGRYTPALDMALQRVDRALMHAFTSSYLAFAFIPSRTVVAGPHNVFPIDTFAAFCALQGQPHDVWVRFFGSSLEDRLRYTPTDCFETFPLPAGVLEHAAGNSSIADNGPLTTLEAAGGEYYEFRAALMVKNDEGLTKTYNRFHDPDETSEGILKLRELHAAMDRAVLEAYGWHDLAERATCEFLLDYEEEDDEEEGSGFGVQGSGGKRRKKKPWRYRWPDEFRDEVLARLLELNKQRAEEERLSGAAASAAEEQAARPKAKRGRKKQGPGLFEE
jgi:hypothetical protein